MSSKYKTKETNNQEILFGKGPKITSSYTIQIPYVPQCTIWINKSSDNWTQCKSHSISSLIISLIHKQYVKLDAMKAPRRQKRTHTTIVFLFLHNTIDPVKNVVIEYDQNNVVIEYTIQLPEADLWSKMLLSHVMEPQQGSENLVLHCKAKLRTMYYETILYS
jgi:hypothetical protein